jgi:hypothetical protein
MATSHHFSTAPFFSVGREIGDPPYWFAPLAWGVVVNSSTLLLRTPCKSSLLGWRQLSVDCYHLDLGKTRLRVRRTNDGRFWLISRWPPEKSMRSDRESETLVHGFGSAPLVTTDPLEAIHLAFWFLTNDAIGGLRWAKASPEFLIPAIAFANRRAKREGLTISWNDLWASSAHSRRMKRGGARHRNGKLLLPVIVRAALHTDSQP